MSKEGARREKIRRALEEALSLLQRKDLWLGYTRLEYSIALLKLELGIEGRAPVHDRGHEEEEPLRAIKEGLQLLKEEPIKTLALLQMTRDRIRRELSRL